MQGIKKRMAHKDHPLTFMLTYFFSGRLCVVGNKTHGNGIHTMAGVLSGKTLPGEHVPEMASAVGAHNLCAASVCIRDPFYGTWYFIVKTGPSAVRIEFVFGMIEGCIALAAHVGTTGFVIGILAGKSAFRAFVQDHPGFFVGEFVV